MAITTWAATTGDWDDSKFSRAWDGPNIAPAKGDLTLSSVAPGGGRSHFASPDSASFELLQSYEWDQLTTSWVTTPGDWSSGPVPQVAVGTGISPDKADLTFTAYSPKSGIMYDFRINASTLTLTGQLPFAGEGFTISPDNATLTIIQVYSWDNYGGTWAASSDNWDVVPFVPTAIETGQNEPANADLTLTGIAPNVTLQKLWYVPTADLTLSSSANPSAGFGINVGAGSLTGLSSATWETYGGDWASASDTWGTGTVSPEVGVTYIFPIDSADEFAFTASEPQWPLIRDPKFIAQVLLS